VGTPFPSASIIVAQTVDFASPPNEGVTLYLHRVSIHTSIRNLPPRTAPDGRQFRPSLPLDLHYLVTPWARSAARQQELLGWVIRAIEDRPTLPTSLLNTAGTIFREGEVVDVVAQPMTPLELVAIWEFNKAIMQPSMTYLARMVQLDSDLELPGAGRIQSRGTSATPNTGEGP
jgi:hypothetical protein